MKSILPKTGVGRNLCLGNSPKAACQPLERWRLTALRVPTLLFSTVHPLALGQLLSLCVPRFPHLQSRPVPRVEVKRQRRTWSAETLAGAA